GRVYGEAVEILLCPGAGRHRLELGKGAVQIVSHRTIDLGDFHVLVVEGVHQVGGEIIAMAALAAFEDHGARSSASKSATRISAMSRQAASRSCRQRAEGPPSAAFMSADFSRPILPIRRAISSRSIT